MTGLLACCGSLVAHINVCMYDRCVFLCLSVCQCWLAGCFYSLTHSPLIQCTHRPSVCVVTRSVRCSVLPAGSAEAFLHTHTQGRDIQTQHGGHHADLGIFLTSLSLVIDSLHSLPASIASIASIHQCTGSIGRRVPYVCYVSKHVRTYESMYVCMCMCMCVLTYSVAYVCECECVYVYVYAHPWPAMHSLQHIFSFVCSLVAFVLSARMDGWMDGRWTLSLYFSSRLSYSSRVCIPHVPHMFRAVIRGHLISLFRPAVRPSVRPSITHSLTHDTSRHTLFGHLSVCLSVSVCRSLCMYSPSLHSRNPLIYLLCGLLVRGYSYVRKPLTLTHSQTPGYLPPSLPARSNCGRQFFSALQCAPWDSTTQRTAWSQASS